MNSFKTKAKVRWFDEHSGVGVISVINKDSKYNNKNFTIYACNIKGSKSAFEHLACVSYKDGQIVTVEIHYDEYDYSVKGITKGKLVADKYERLKSTIKNSAFQLDSKGQFKSGLFANKKATK